MAITSLLDRKLTVQRPAVAYDASGGAVRSFSTLLAGVPCAVAPARASVSVDYARRDSVVDHHVYSATDFAALMPGGLRLGDRLAEGSVYYLVKGVKRLANSLVTSEVMYEVDCERRD